MCLLIFAWNAHPRYRLVFAGNRDEFHERPTAAMAWWNEQDAPGGRIDPCAGGILAGRDLRAGGTWLGLSRDGRFGVVTNFRDLQKAEPDAPSRGELITRFLAQNVSAQQFSDELAPDAARYAGFNLLLADAATMVYFSNRSPALSRALPSGIYGLSNHFLDTPWPKLERTRERFRSLMSAPDPSPDALLEMLGDREPALDHLLPQTGLSREWELLLSSPFIVDERYGTRCSTVAMIGYDGQVLARERRFDAAGRSTGMDEFTFALPRSSDAMPA
jgi:uncharacterized protein with NRDE domain